MPSTRKAIADLVDRLIAGWNRHDAAAFGDVFTAQAEYVTGAGRLLRTRRAIQRLVATAEDSAIRLERRPSVRMHGECASVRLHWRGKRSERAPRRGIITLVVVFDGEWRIDRLHNTDAI